MKEKEVIAKFFDHIAQGDGLVTYGVQDTMKYLENGVVGKLICYEGLEHLRIRVRNPENGIVSTIYCKPDQVTNPALYMDGEVELERIDDEVDEESSLCEWLSTHYKDFGCELEFVTDKSPEGTQFLKGFAGLGGFLRYKIDLDVQEADYVEEDEDDDFI